MVRFFYIYTNYTKLVSLLKILIRCALFVFCKKIQIQNKQYLKQKGPLLIIANHPDSFLDAIIIGSYYKRRVHFLARGDAFTKKHHRFLLGLLNMIPIYRLREGREFLHLNEYAFTASKNLLAKGEAVLIFIEGICLNTNELQPFKKGTARILQSTQEMGVHPNIHVAGIAYNHFFGMGKRVNIKIDLFYFHPTIKSGQDRVDFNNAVFKVLKENIQAPETETNKPNNNTPLFLLGRFVRGIQTPYYLPIKKYIYQKTKNSVFFDSVLFSILLLTYPIFLLFVGLLLYLISTPLPIIFIILVGLPLLSRLGIK
jgi:1-acyl-sn-glycerol-3-phosphate acyltransferase